MSKTTTTSIADELDLFQDINPDQVADLPSFEPFPSGTYNGLKVVSEMQTSGSEETRDYWKRVDISLELMPDTEVTLTQADAVLPADGSKTTFTYTIAQFDEKQGKIIQTGAPYQATNKKGEVYDSKGSYARINADWIIPSGGQVPQKDLAALFNLLKEEPMANVVLGQRVGKKDEETGIRPVYQQIKQITYITD